MRANWLLAATSALLLAAHYSVVAAERYAVHPRQDVSSDAAAVVSTTKPDTNSQSTPRSTKGASAAAASTTNIPLSSETSSTTATPTNAAASSTLVVTATPISKGSLNSNTTTTANIQGLPIEPRITPAFSVAGAILIITGAFYTLVGIKTKWFHIFLSTAYLFSLAVTVLIIYVTHPPIPNPVQGAYFAAACITGLMAGGASVLFKDLTEGVGCFLGGFCLSMWFLVLKPGGLIASTAGKITFIACLTLGAFALYISHRTRPYGLIGSTSFAGATVIVVGIDCFSRAGLKEFWVYVWNLNSDIFPLHYKGPYPTTRGIRVEIAAIILIWLMGIMSQMKVWNIIKKRRQEKAKEQRDKDEERNMADENHGRRVEEGIKRERGSWEAAHGSSGRGKIVHLDSGIGTDEPSTRKGSMSVTGMSETRGLDSEGLELQEMEDPGKYLKEGGRVTVHVAQDDEIPQFQSPTGRRSIGSARETILEPFFHESLTQASRPMGSEAPPRNLSAKGSSKSIGPGLTLKPKITRLPFKVPSPDPQSDDDSSSVAASAASALDPAQSSKRTSGSPITRKLSKRSLRRYVAGSTSEEALMIPYPEDDQASSVAATIDGVSDQANSEDERTKGRSQSPSHDPEKDASMEEPMQGMNQGVDNAASGRSTNHSLAGESQVVGAPSPVGTFALRPEITVLPSSERSRASSIDGLQKTTKQPHNESISKCEASPEDFERRPERASLSGNLPEGASKVVTAYRTNEWAKHLDAADIPDFDELKLNEVRATNSALHNERPVPIDKGALQQTPLDAEPAPMLTLKTHKLGERPASYFKSKDPFKRHSDVHQSRSHMHQLTREKAMERSPSQTSLANSMSRSPSQASLDSNSARKEHYPPMLSRVRSSQSFTSLHRGLRSSSSPLISTPLSAPLAQSPIEEGVEACFPARFTPSTAHLMSQRDSMLRNRPSSTSLLRTTWSNSALDQHPALRSPEDEDDNISLSQRKSLLQKNQQVVPQPRRSSSGPMATPTYTPARDSLTPQPANQEPTLTPRDSTISAWRASLQPSTTAHYRDQEIEHRRSAMLAEKRRESTSRQEQRVGKEVNQNVLDRGMRRSNMLDAHAGMMRKMQAEANKSLH